MKKKNIITIIIFNLFVLALFLYALTSYILAKNTQTIPYIFGQRRDNGIIICILIGIIIESLMLIVLAIYKKKIINKIVTLIPIVIFAPICLFLLVALGFARDYNHEVKLNKYNETLIISRESYFHHSNTYIYIKESPFTCKYICQFGSDIYSYDLYEYENGIKLTSDKNELYLKYINGDFVEVETLEELL